MKKAILYVNQFFGQIGGEEKAGAEPEIHEGHVGPAMQFAKELDAEITHTTFAVITIWEAIPMQQ